MHLALQISVFWRAQFRSGNTGQNAISVNPVVQKGDPLSNLHIQIILGAVHILRKNILGSLNTLGGVVSTW